MQEKKVDVSPADGLDTRLRAYLSVSGQSAKGFAERASIPYRTFQDYTAGHRLPGAEHLARMGLAGIDLDWLVCGRRNSEFSFVFSFPKDLKGFRSFLAADQESLSRVVSYVEPIVYDVMKRCAIEGLPPLPPFQIIGLMWSAVSVIDDAFLKSEDRFLEMIKRGVSFDDLVDAALSLISERLTDSLMSAYAQNAEILSSEATGT